MFPLRHLLPALALFLLPALSSAAPHHEHKPPHNGTLIEIGEHFAHVELILDPADGKMIAYILDGEAQESIRSAQPTLRFQIGPRAAKGTTFTAELKAQASPLTGETVGDSSEFSATFPQLKGMKGFLGKLEEIQIKGTSNKEIIFSFPEGNDQD